VAYENEKKETNVTLASYTACGNRAASSC